MVVLPEVTVPLVKLIPTVVEVQPEVAVPLIVVALTEVVPGNPPTQRQQRADGGAPLTQQTSGATNG